MQGLEFELEPTEKYRIYSIKRRGVYWIFSVSDAAFIQGWHLLEGDVYFEITDNSHLSILCNWKVTIFSYFADIES